MVEATPACLQFARGEWPHGQHITWTNMLTGAETFWGSNMILSYTMTLSLFLAETEGEEDLPCVVIFVGNP